MKAFILDDEPLARKGIKKMIDQYPSLEFAGEANNPLEAAELLKEQKVDLLFLDINMPYMSGIEFLNQMTNRPKVIITSAYTDHIPEAFNLKVDNYLLKPIGREQFSKAISKLIIPNDNVKNDSGKGSSQDIFIKHNGQFVKLCLDDILFVKAVQNYIKIYCNDGSYICHKTLKSIEEALPTNRFFRVQKSYLINLNKVSSFESNLIYIEDHTIPVSRSLSQCIKEMMMSKAIIL